MFLEHVVVSEVFPIILFPLVKLVGQLAIEPVGFAVLLEEVGQEELAHLLVFMVEAF